MRRTNCRRSHATVRAQTCSGREEHERGIGSGVEETHPARGLDSTTPACLSLSLSNLQPPSTDGCLLLTLVSYPFRSQLLTALRLTCAACITQESRALIDSPSDYYMWPPRLARPRAIRRGHPDVLSSGRTILSMPLPILSASRRPMPFVREACHPEAERPCGLCLRRACKHASLPTRRRRAGLPERQ